MDHRRDNRRGTRRVRGGSQRADRDHRVRSRLATQQVVREFTQAVIHVAGARTAVEKMRRRGVAFEEYDTPETRTGNGVAAMPGGSEAAWFKDSEGNLAGIVPALRRISRVSEPPRRVVYPRRLV